MLLEKSEQQCQAAVRSGGPHPLPSALLLGAALWMPDMGFLRAELTPLLPHRVDPLPSP